MQRGVKESRGESTCEQPGSVPYRASYPSASRDEARCCRPARESQLAWEVKRETERQRTQSRESSCTRSPSSARRSSQLMLEERPWRRRTHLCTRRVDLVEEEVEVAEAKLLAKVGVELPVVLALVLPRLLGVGVALVDEEVVWEDVVRDARDVELVEARRLVAPVADEPLVAPASGEGERGSVRERTIRLTRVCLPS